MQSLIGTRWVYRCQTVKRIPDVGASFQSNLFGLPRESRTRLFRVKRDSIWLKDPDLNSLNSVGTIRCCNTDRKCKLKNFSLFKYRLLPESNYAPGMHGPARKTYLINKHSAQTGNTDQNWKYSEKYPENKISWNFCTVYPKLYA